MSVTGTAKDQAAEAREVARVAVRVVARVEANEEASMEARAAEADQPDLGAATPMRKQILYTPLPCPACITVLHMENLLFHSSSMHHALYCEYNRRK